MRLIGSLTEDREREELAASNARMRRGDHPLAGPLQAAGIDPATAYVLEWIPEQGEDLFVVLTGDRDVLRIEVVRQDGSTAAFERLSLMDYQPSGQRARIRLALALNLLEAVR
jgi:hypothetical protein